MSKRRNATDFLKEAVTVPRIIRISGDEGVGKSSLALTATAPEAKNPSLMYYFDWDQGLERAHRALGELPDPDACHITSYGFPAGEVTEKNAADMFAEWQEDFADALDDIEENNGGTLVLDTESQWTDIVTLVMTNKALQERIAKRRGKKVDAVDYVQRLDYGLRNAFIEKTILNCRGLPNTRFVMITRLGPVFEGATDTGRKEPKGYKSMGYMVELDIKLRRKGDGKRELFIITDKFEDANTGTTLDFQTLPALMEEFYG